MKWFSSKSTCLHTLLVCGLLWWTPVLRAKIDVELRPLSQEADVNDIIEVQLFVVSDSEFSQSLLAMDIVFTWDANRLKLLGNIDPCTKSPCPENTYAWLQSWFPVDQNLDGLNDDCGDGVFCESISCDSGCPDGVICDNFSGFCKATGLPVNDGDAKYVAWSNIGNSALVSPAGLWVTTFRFQAISTGTAEVRVLESLGEFSFTQIADGDLPGLVVTGMIGPPAKVIIGGCPPPFVESVGSRYVSITPAASNDPVALRVLGAPNDPSIDCVSLYVQLDGTLGEDAVDQLPEAWGTVFVGDQFIIPDSRYEIITDCDATTPGLVSESVSVTTKAWADVNEDGAIDFRDLILMADGALGIFNGGTTLQSLDLLPCIPDRVIDELDISAIKDAMIRLPFPCREPCLLHIPLEDWSGFLSCMQGPDTQPPVLCAFFDLNFDHLVDLQDVSLFMIRP